MSITKRDDKKFFLSCWYFLTQILVLPVVLQNIIGVAFSLQIPHSVNLHASFYFVLAKIAAIIFTIF